MHTVVSSATKTVTIGPDQPFCIIGERINPTGRKIFQEQLRAGDLSAIERDVIAQVETGATMLDVIRATKSVGGDLMARVVCELAAGQIAVRENRAEEGSYFGWPTIEQIRRFRRQGGRLA